MPLKCLRLMLTGLAKITSEVLERVSFQVKSISHCLCIAKCLHPCQNPMNTAGMHPPVGFHVVHHQQRYFHLWASMWCISAVMLSLVGFHVVITTVMISLVGFHVVLLCSDAFTCGLLCGARLEILTSFLHVHWYMLPALS